MLIGQTMDFAMYPQSSFFPLVPRQTHRKIVADLGHVVLLAAALASAPLVVLVVAYLTAVVT